MYDLLHAETVNDYETVFPKVVRSSRDARSVSWDITRIDLAFVYLLLKFTYISVQQVDGSDSEIIVSINTTNETLTFHLKLNE